LLGLAVELLALLEEFILGLELGLLEDILGFFLGLGVQICHAGGRTAEAEAIQETGGPVTRQQRQESGREAVGNNFHGATPTAAHSPLRRNGTRDRARRPIATPGSGPVNPGSPGNPNRSGILD